VFYKESGCAGEGIPGLAIHSIEVPHFEEAGVDKNTHEATDAMGSGGLDMERRDELGEGHGSAVAVD